MASGESNPQTNFLEMFPQETVAKARLKSFRVRRHKKIGLEGIAEEVQRLANAPKQSREPSLRQQYTERLPMVSHYIRRRIQEGKQLSEAEQRRWVQYHSQRQSDIILSAWGLKNRIDQEGFTPEIIALLSKRVTSLPKDWKYGVEPGSDAYAAVKRNEMEFEKWRALTRAAKKAKKTLTPKV